MTTEYLGDDRALFLDISSTCTGYVVASMCRATKVATIHKAGVLWFGKDWPHGQKYRYLQEFIVDVAYVQYRIQDIVAEQYFTNPHSGMGTQVVSEATGAAKASCFEVMPPMGFYLIPPQSWRAALEIKKDTTKKGKLAFKDPTKAKIEELLKIKLPEKMVSNIDGKSKTTPSDLADALGVCMGWLSLEPNSCTKFIIAKGAIDVPTT